jgi:hypothetical protein
MKRVIFPVIILCAALFVVIGCSNEKAIEKTINDWTSAINDADPDAMRDAVSPDSEMYDPALIDTLIKIYFADFDPVSYDLGDMNIDNPYADVPADAVYAGIPNAAKFVMKKKQGFFSFLAPEWNVYKYFDNGNFDPGEEVWKKLKKQP